MSIRSRAQYAIRDRSRNAAAAPSAGSVETTSMEASCVEATSVEATSVEAPTRGGSCRCKRNHGNCKYPDTNFPEHETILPDRLSSPDSLSGTTDTCSQPAAKPIAAAPVLFVGANRPVRLLRRIDGRPHGDHHPGCGRLLRSALSVVSQRQEPHRRVLSPVMILHFPFFAREFALAAAAPGGPPQIQRLTD